MHSAYGPRFPFITDDAYSLRIGNSSLSRTISSSFIFRQLRLGKVAESRNLIHKMHPPSKTQPRRRRNTKKTQFANLSPVSLDTRRAPPSHFPQSATRQLPREDPPNPSQAKGCPCRVPVQSQSSPSRPPGLLLLVAPCMRQRPRLQRPLGRGAVRVLPHRPRKCG